MRRKVALLLSLALVAVTAIGCGSKSSYPSKNVSVIVPFGAGGNTDMSIRALLNVATEEVDDGYTFVVDNKTGNGGLVGMEALAESDNDGYTLGATAVDLMLHICFGRTEVTMDDFIPIACTMADPYGIIVDAASSNYSSLEEFVEYAKANPGAVKVGDTGSGSAPNVAAKAFEMYFDVEFDYYTYDTSADCITAIQTGEIDATFSQPSPAVSSIEAGLLDMLAIMSDTRLSSFPDVPTILEVYGEEYSLVIKGWVALTAPAGTDDDIIDTLREVMGEALATEAYEEQITSLGMEYMVLYGEELEEFWAEQMEFYAAVCATIDLDE